MTESDQIIQGYDCECGEHHKYPAYVFAHYNEPLLHTCQKCGRKHTVMRGKAVLVSGNTLASAARALAGEEVEEG